MAKLLFRPADLLNEITALQGIAGRFVDRTSPFKLDELGGGIQGLQAKGGNMVLEIPEERPLKTRVSVGEFEPPSKKSRRRVYGSITGIWQVEGAMHALQDTERTNKKARPTMLIGFTGKASTVVQVMDESTGEIVACWKMEIGDTDAPGCFFHTSASLDHRFPVPRHPNVFTTPMSAIGFALGELFQGAWEKAVSGTTDAPNRWRSIQSKRFKALLGWQLEQVDRTTSCPWCSLKMAKPSNALFL